LIDRYSPHQGGGERSYGPFFWPNDTIGVVLNMDEGYMAFVKDAEVTSSCHQPVLEIGPHAVRHILPYALKLHACSHLYGGQVFGEHKLDILGIAYRHVRSGSKGGPKSRMLYVDPCLVNQAHSAS
jgi:hypothetical protein